MSKQAKVFGAHVPVASFADTLSTLEKIPARAKAAERPARAALDPDTQRRLAREEGTAEGHAEGLRKGYEEGLEIGKIMGREQAYADVEAEFRAAADARLRTLEDALTEFSEGLEAATADWFRAAELALTPLVLRVAERVVTEELKLRPEAAAAIVADALGEVSHATHARVRVNPLHRPAVEAERDRLLAMAHSLRNLEITDDPSILGGCVIDTDGGVIDARIERKLDALGQALEVR